MTGRGFPVAASNFAIVPLDLFRIIWASLRIIVETLDKTLDEAGRFTRLSQEGLCSPVRKSI